MQWFLIIVGSMFVGAILGLFLLWFGIKFLIRRFLKKLSDALGVGGEGVPPFRITLEGIDPYKWQNGKVVDGISKALEGAGYSRIGDFAIEETPATHLRGFVNTTTNTYGVIAEYADKPPVLDIACDFQNGDHLTVTTAPESGLDRPDYSQMLRSDADLVASPASATMLHETVLEEQQGRPTVTASASAFTRMYAEAYAREMDWRIARGGVTAAEIRRSCEAAGTDIPDDQAVALVRKQWQCAISEFINEQLREKFLKYVTKMSAAEWEEVRDRLYFVHERSVGDAIVEQLSWHVAASEAANGNGASNAKQGEDDDDEDLDTGSEAAQVKLRPLFDGVPVRQAFAKAQDLLPPDRRYQRVASIKTPYGADVYVEPKFANDDA